MTWVCVAGGGMHDGGMHGMEGVCAGETATEAGSTHPTGILSRSICKIRISDAKHWLSRVGGGAKNVSTHQCATQSSP